jgi:predicted outer membrane repeat protein
MLASAGAASAATYTVNDTTDAPLATSTNTNCISTHNNSCTLRAAVQAADNAGGANTISLPAGDYKLTIAPTCTTYSNGCDQNDPSKGDLDVNSRDNGTSITVTGAGSGSTVIDANVIDRAFAVENDALGNGTVGGLTLSGLTIENGQPAVSSGYYLSTGGGCGGAVYSAGALATTSDVVMENNTAANRCHDGGAIYSHSGTGSSLSVAGTTFSANNGDHYGGAIYYDASGAASITGSTFDGNYASNDGGGAIYSDGGAMTIDSSTFSNNLSYDGGAIYWDNTTDLTVRNSTFSNNNGYDGGVLYDNNASSVTWTHDRFTGNSAYDGGVLYNGANTSDVYTFTSDEFDNNHATYEGVGDFEDFKSLTDTGSSYIGNSGAYGGVYYIGNSGSPLSFTNDTMSDNASDFGGALYLQSLNPLTMTNDTIAFNTATAHEGGGIAYAQDANSGSIVNTVIAENTGGDCGDGTSTPQFSSSVDAGYNLDSDGTCFGYTGHPGTDKVGVNPQLNGPADNGGSNVAGAPGTTETIQTDAETPSSATVNAGTNSGCPSTDARGVPRPQGGICDMGAFELQAAGLGLAKAGPSSADTNVPFSYTVTASDSSSNGPSSGTTVVDQLPAGETLYGTTPSQGACSASGSPAKVTCDLGAINPGSSATVSLIVAEANAGSVTNTATATNNEGQSITSNAVTTQVLAPVAPAGATGPNAITGGHAQVAKHHVKLLGKVTTGGQPTWYFFQYGRTKKLGLASRLVRITSSSSVSAIIRHLLAGKKYFFRLVAVNDSGFSYGALHHFKTKKVKKHKKHHH